MMFFAICCKITHKPLFRKFLSNAVLNIYGKSLRTDKTLSVDHDLISKRSKSRRDNGLDSLFDDTGKFDRQLEIEFGRSITEESRNLNISHNGATYTTSYTKLPKVPLPNIKETMEKYLDAVVSFISPEDYDRAKRQVREFSSHEEDIKKVELYLKKRNEELDNWAYNWWLEDMYLNNMLPLPVNSNPGIVFPRQNFKRSTRLMHKYLARIMYGISEFKQTLERGKLEQDVMQSRDNGRQLLCMEQYGKLLNSYRRPGSTGQDELVCNPPTERHDSEYVIVMANGHMYVMYVKMDDKWFSIGELNNGLDLIQKDINTRMNSNLMTQRVQILTSDNRLTWAANREKIINLSELNKKNLLMIENCLYVVCLDQSIHNPSDHSVSYKDMLRQMLTGHGSKINGGNRWFDKTIQLVASPDGVNGVCLEHTQCEGVVFFAMFQNILNNMEEEDNKTNQVPKSKPNHDTSLSREDMSWVNISIDCMLIESDFREFEAPRERKMFKRLEWNVNEEIAEEILKAEEKYNILNQNTDLEVYRFNDYGANFVRARNCSPDSYVQMALQLSYYKIYGELCATYESASTRRFRQGRVDCVRASHKEALEWVKFMMKHGLLDIQTEQIKLFKIAIEKQTKLMKDNITGKGMDIPMLGIRRAVNEIWNTKKDHLSEEEIQATAHLKALFDDPVFDTANDFKLSTSQVTTTLKNSFAGYGAVTPDGYGCSYNLQNDHITFCIGSFFSCTETSSILFVESLEESLNEMKEMLTDHD